MTILRLTARFAAAIATLMLANCANKKLEPQLTADGKPINPHPAGTYEHFTAEPSYPKTYSVWKNEELLSRTNPDNSSIYISLGKQRGMLMNGDQVVIDYPICSGTKSRPTPPGT